ncbi:MAG: hypothetical protein K2I07_02415 [Lachnospiraceae bacterium]|nr:hypothetical protein [Lachnospiraceae bacterium]
MMFCRELKKIIWGIPYLLFVVVLTLALFSQGVLEFDTEGSVSKPEPGGNYGTKNEEIPELIMPAALQSLYAEFQQNEYRTYPIGFIKTVKLNDKEQAEIAEIISRITGIDTEKLYGENENSYTAGEFSIQIDGDGSLQPDGNGGFTISMDDAAAINSMQEEPLDLTVRANLSYSEFRELMQRADDLLGGGSDYAADALIGFGTVPVTYEEALERYELMKTRDHVTGGYARLFSDYAVAMALSILPVFLAVIMDMKDRSCKMAELIYTRKASGIKIIFTRYFALLTAVMLPIILLSYLSNAGIWGMYQGMDLDYFAPLKYDLGWIMPSAMIAIALGMCLTELTNTPLAIAVQGLWWFVDINMGIKSVASSYSLFRLAPRHNAGTNTYFRTQDFIDNFPRLITNRLLFAGLSILLVIVTIVIFEANRKGQINGNHKLKKALANFRNRKDQSPA